MGSSMLCFPALLAGCRLRCAEAAECGCGQGDIRFNAHVNCCRQGTLSLDAVVNSVSGSPWHRIPHLAVRLND